jgi:uncharacterized protein
MAYWNNREDPASARIDIVDRISDVPVRQPDLEPAGIYQSRAWLSAIEETTAGTVRYVVVWNAAGALLGWLPVYLLRPSAAGPYDPRRCLGLSASAGRPDLIAVLGGRAGYLTGWPLVRRESAQSRTGLSILLTAAARVAADAGADMVAAHYLPPVEATLLASTGLVAADEVVPHAYGASIALVGDRFDDQVATLPANRRSVVGRDLARFARSGQQMRVCRLADAMPFAPRLLAAVQARHGEPADEDLVTEMLRAQAELVNEQSVVIAAYDGNTPVAYSLSYAHRDTLHVRLAGLDHERAERSGAYFITTYYAPMRYAYSAGLRTVELGTGSLRPKLLRGARLTARYSVGRYRSGAPIGPIERAAVAERLRASLAELGDLAAGAVTGRDGHVSVHVGGV